MSSKWRNDGVINVRGSKKVGDVLAEIGPEYWRDAFTCLGARHQAKMYL